jgi:hypothetical protein
MKWYFYLNYCVYRFYNRKKDEIPVYTAFLVPILLVMLNTATIDCVYWFIRDFWIIPQMAHLRIKAVVYMSFLGLINYLLLYRKKKYEDVFEEFRRNYDRYKKWNKSVKLYIILTIVVAILVSIIADVRNQHVQKYSSEKAATTIRSNPGSGFIRLSGFAHGTGLRQSVGLPLSVAYLYSLQSVHPVGMHPQRDAGKEGGDVFSTERCIPIGMPANTGAEYGPSTWYGDDDNKWFK